MEQAKLSLRDKPAARWGALAIISLTMFFAYMFVDVLSPVKTLVETELGWDSTVFGLYGGSGFDDAGRAPIPKIKIREIAPQTDEQDRLKVKIEVVAN